jgi:hypothetical protein
VVAILRIPQRVTSSLGPVRLPYPTTNLPLGGPSLAHAAAPAPPTLVQQAQGEVDPILAQIRAQVLGQAKNAGQAITGYTNDLAGKLGSVDYAAPYTGAEGQQAAVDASLAQALAGGGLAGAADLKSRLAQIGEPGVVGAAGDAVAATGTGNSNTVLAQGSSNLGALIANAAAAKSYGQKLPGIARLAGLQDIAGANSAVQTQIGTETTSVMNQLPSIVNALRSASLARASQAATNKYRTDSLASSTKTRQIATILGAGVDPTTGTLTPAAATALGKLTGVDPRALSGTSATVAGRIIGANATAAGRQTAAAEKAVPKLSTSTSRALGYAADQYGNPWGGKVKLLPGFGYNTKGAIVKTSTSTSSKQHGLTTLKVDQLKGNALAIAEGGFAGGQFDANGQPKPNGGFNAKKQATPPLSRAQVIDELDREGIPAWVYLPAVNSVYEPGGSRSAVAGPPAPGRRG